MSVAQDAAALEAIGRLRYELYIARDGKAYAHADNARRCFLEPVDDVSLNFQARDGGRVLAAVRLTRAEDALADPQMAMLVQASGLTRLADAVVNSRFVVLPTLGARRSIIPMFQEVYCAGLHSGARVCLVATRVELVSIFERFGFRRCKPVIRDQVVGPLALLQLDAFDFGHLRAVRSPYLEVARRLFGEELQASRFDGCELEAVP